MINFVNQLRKALFIMPFVYFDIREIKICIFNVSDSVTEELPSKNIILSDLVITSIL